MRYYLYCSFLDNNIPTQRSSKKHACEEAAMYIDLTNEMDYNVTYNIVVASSEYPMYNVIDNTVISGVVPGYSEDELVTFGAYVSPLFPLHYRLEKAPILEALSMQSTSQSTAISFLPLQSELLCHSTPLRKKSVHYSTLNKEKVIVSLTQDGNKLYASMSRSHYLFCMVCTRYVGMD